MASIVCAPPAPDASLYAASVPLALDSWSPQVERLAESLVMNLQERVSIKSQISSLQSRLSVLEEEHHQLTLLQRLKQNNANVVWSELADCDKWRKEVVLAALMHTPKGGDLPRLLHEKYWNSRTCFLIPKHIKDDKDIFLARLEREEFLEYCSKDRYCSCCRCFHDHDDDDDDDSDEEDADSDFDDDDDDDGSTESATRPPRATDEKTLRIPPSLVNDKSVMLQVVRRYPDIILNGGLKDDFLSDADFFEAFLQSSLHGTKPNYNSMVCRFSESIRSNASLMIQAMEKLQVASGWQPVLCLHQSLFDDKDFLLQVAALQLEWFNRDCFIGLRHVSKRLQGDIEVVKAFCQVDGNNLSDASLSLRGHYGVIRRACRENPAALLLAPKQSQAMIVHEKDFCISLFVTEEEHGSRPRIVPTETYTQLWKLIPKRLQSDREVAFAAAAAAFTPNDVKETVLKAKNVPWEDDYGFWQALLSRRPQNWEILPEQLKDESFDLALLAARSCEDYDDCELLDMLYARMPSVFDDRQVLRNLASHHGAHCENCWKRFLRHGAWGDKEFCLELLRLDGHVYEFVSPHLHSDSDVVQAALAETFVLSLLPYEVQLQHSDLVALALENDDIDMHDLYDEICPQLWENRNVAMAWINQGGAFLDDDFPEEFSQDQELLLVLAEHHPSEIRCDADDSLFSNKEFMLKLIQKGPSFISFVDSSLEGDFDLMLAAFSATDDANVVDLFDSKGGSQEGLQHLANFTSELRHRLALHKSFLTILGGIALSNGDSQSPDCHLPLLNQGEETSRGYMSRIVECLGLERGEELQRLRSASLNLARCGY